MLTVETIGRIRREYFVNGKTIRQISRDLRVSRNTVRKVLRSGETSFAYDRDVQPLPKLGRWTADLDELLAGNTTKAAREQLTLICVFEELRGRGYESGYDAVRRYARRWAKERGQSTAAAFVPLIFAPAPPDSGVPMSIVTPAPTARSSRPIPPLSAPQSPLRRERPPAVSSRFRPS